MRNRLPLPVVLCVILTALSVADDSRSSRWEDAILAFEESDRQQPPPAGGTLFLGSSSVRLWDLEAAFPGLPVINRGFGGSEIIDATHFADRIAIPYAPRAIVLYAGDNDISRDKTACRVYGDFREFVSTIHAALPETRIVFIAIKPSLARWELIHDIRAANALIRADCERNALLTYVDVEEPMLGDDRRPRPELFKDDGLHLNEAGYSLWGELVRPHIESALPIDN